MKVSMIKTNCCVIDTKDGAFLQSYNTLICYQPYDSSPILLTPGQPQSVTTAKHLSQWLGEPYRNLLKDGRMIVSELPKI